MNNKLYRILALLLILFSYLNIAAQPIYFVENQSAKVNKSEINGSDLKQLNMNSIGLYGIATDYVNKKLYYSNVVTDEIFISDLDGSNPTIILNNSNDSVDGPRGISIDNKNNRIFWAEAISGKIRSADLDGNNVTDVITGLESPVDVALDLESDLVYWSNNGIGQKNISHSNLDGTSISINVSGSQNWGGIELDVENNNLYFFYYGSSDNIYVLNTATSILSIFLSIPDQSPRGLSIDRYSKSLFWTNVIDSSLNRIQLDGTSKLKIISGLSHPMGISGDNPSTLPVLVDLKIMLEGPYNIIDMNTNLGSLIPIVSPYPENLRIVDPIPANIVDWALVELRETQNGLAVASKSVLLNKDGRIVADNGTSSTINISADPKDYFLVIKHRNHLPIMSKSKINLTVN